MVIDCCVIILTCLFPPAGVFLISGIGADLVINICLTILGFLPGHIHAFYLLVQHASKPQAYQAVPTTTVTKATTPNGQHRQYDVYQPKQQQQLATQPVAQPIQRDKKDALVDNNYQQQQQYGQSSYNNNNASYSGQYKSTDGGNPPPSYKS